MPITFRCQPCGKSYTVADSFAGRRARCKVCGAEMLIPTAAATKASKPADLFGLDEGLDGDSVEAEVPMGRVGASRRRSSEDSGSLLWLYVACGGAAGLALLIGLIVALAGGRGGKPEANNGEGDHLAQNEAPPPIPRVPSGRPRPSAPPNPADPPNAAPRFVRPDQAGGATNAAALAPWRVGVDPAPDDQAAAFPDAKPFELPIPETFSSDRVLYPTTPSPFVAIGANDNASHMRDVVDLRDGRRVGRIMGQQDFNRPMALSPDGRFLAGHSNATPRKSMIWSVADARLVGAIEDGKQIPTILDFAGPSRVVMGTFHTDTLQVWDFQEGKLVREVKVVPWWEKNAVAFSPGRRYIALASQRDARVRVHDLETGLLAGEDLLPTDGPAKPDALGMAFSPDGSLLTGLFKVGRTHHLVTWNVRDGKRASEFTATGDDPYGKAKFYEGNRLQWLPDQSGWFLFDQVIVDRQSGQRVWTLPFDAIKQGLEEAPRKLLDWKRAVIVAKQGNRRVLRVAPLPAEKIRNALEIARSGGSAVDATLPPLTKVDLAAAPRINIGDTTAAWSYHPAAPRNAPALPHRPIALKARAHELLGLAFAGPTTPRAVVLSGPGGILGGRREAEAGGAPRQAERVDLATGRALNRFDVPAIHDLVDLSPDAARVLLIEAKGRERLDVLNAADGKPVAAWRPPTAATWAAFADPDHVLTTDAEGTLACWSLPEVKPVYVIDRIVEGRPTLTPDRTALAISARSGGLLLIESATGKLLGRAETPSGETKALAVRSDGGELAAIVGDSLVRIDLNTGAAGAEAPAPIGQLDRIRYAGNTHLLVDDKWLYDLEHQRIIWVFHGGVTGPVAPDGWYWYAAGSTNIGAASLNAIELPGKEARQAAEAAFAPNAKGLIAPGATLSVSFEGNAPRDAAGFRQAVLDGLSGRLRTLGVTVADKAPVRLAAKIQDRDTGQKMELRRFGGGGQPEVRVVPVYDLTVELTLTDNQGAPIPIIRRTINTPMIMSMHAAAGDNDLEGVYRNYLWLEARKQLTGGELPFFAARRPSGAPLLLPGATALGFPQRF